MYPLKIWLPSPISHGSDSPVRADVSKAEYPLTISPSSGTFSPGFTIIISPGFTSSGETFSIFSPIFKFAKSGLMSIRSEIDFLDLFTAIP